MMESIPLLNIVFPITQITVSPSEVDLKVLGLIDQLPVGFTLQLSKKLQPVFLSTSQGFEPNPSAEWVDAGVCFKAVPKMTDLFVELLSILIKEPLKVPAKEQVPFSALLLMGDMGNFQDFNTEGLFRDIELLPTIPQFESESQERWPDLFKFKLDFVDQTLSENPIQFILSLDLANKVLVFSEKDQNSRKFLLKVFALKDLVNGSSLH